MKITKSQLQKIIKEELLKESEGISDDGVERVISMLNDLMVEVGDMSMSSGMGDPSIKFGRISNKLEHIITVLGRGY